MPPIKFKLYPTYGSRADVIWKISRWLLWWPSWISEQNHFSNSRFPCCPDAFHQVSAPCDTIREQMTIEDFQDGLHGSHHGYCNKLILATLNLHVTQMPPAKFGSIWLTIREQIWRFSRWLLWWPSWISEQNHFSNSKSPCCPDAFHQVSAPYDTIQEQMTIEDFQDGLRGSHHGYHNKMILAILNLPPKCLPPSFGPIRPTIREQMWFEDFQEGCHGGHLG